MLGSKLLETEVSRHVSLGQNILSNLAALANHLQLGNQGVIIYDNNTYLNLEKISNNIMSELINTNRNITKFMLDTKFSNLKSLKSDVEGLPADFIVALGESATIEFVKYLMKQTQNKHLEWISIPTSPSHSGFASPFIFLDIDGKGEMNFGSTKPPIAIIADTELVKSTPDNILKSCIGELLGRYSSIWDWKLAARLRSEPISDFAVLVAEETSEIITKQIDIIKSNNPEFLRIILKGLIIAGFLSGFSSNIRSVYGSEHKFSQSLDQIEPGQILHGERVALGTIMMSSLQGQDWRRIRRTYKQADVPTSAKELEINQSSVVKALVNAVHFPINNQNNKKFYCILGEKGLTEDGAVRLAYRTGVIGNRPGLD